ncbi:MAG TPA: transglutaminase-like domain-containing protein [Thermoanaerobaculia bacterium]|nr:transglutaminase-like domain-containing protein [Thermoanaerobaculia bacterium]
MSRRSRSSELNARFSELVLQPEEQIDLGEAALLLAADEAPDLDIDRWLAELDRLAARAADRLAGDQALDALTRELYQEAGLRGNRLDYYDPRNSFLHEVLGRKLGIPISLGVVCMEVGRRLGLGLSGVGFPGHFLVRVEGGAELYLDPFDRAQRLDRAGCRRLLQRIGGRNMRFEPRFLEPIGTRDILHRMVGNLRAIYTRLEQPHLVLGCLDRQLALEPDRPEDRRERGRIALGLGLVDRAVADLERYLELAPAAEDHAAVEQWLDDAKRGSLVN